MGNACEPCTPSAVTVREGACFRLGGQGGLPAGGRPLSYVLPRGVHPHWMHNSLTTRFLPGVSFERSKNTNVNELGGSSRKKKRKTAPILHSSLLWGLQDMQERGKWVNPTGPDAPCRPCLLPALLRPDRLQGLPPTPPPLAEPFVSSTWELVEMQTLT